MGQQQEADGDRHRQRDGNAPRCLRNDAGRSPGRRQFGHDLRIPARGRAECVSRDRACGPLIPVADAPSPFDSGSRRIGVVTYSAATMHASNVGKSPACTIILWRLLVSH